MAQPPTAPSLPFTDASRDGRCLLLFTKPALPGQVKTRLIGELTPGQAAQLHAAFVEDLVARLSGGSFHLRLAWALEEGEEPPDWPPGQTQPPLRQQGTDLGERMYRAIAEAGRSAPLVVVFGSDHPTVSLELLEHAFERLAAGVPLVLGPALDGGYYLIGMPLSSLHRRLFSDIPWSSGQVLTRTLQRCRELGLAPELLPAAADVDVAEDLRRLIRELAEDDRGCPRTRQLLASWHKLPAAAGTGGSGP